MAEALFERIKNIRAFVLDVDGVLTDGRLLITETGEWLRQMHIKDGFSIKHAIDKQYRFCVISGSGSDAIRDRLSALGITDIYLNVPMKRAVYEQYIIDHKIDISETVYMGDDIPDLECMKIAGLAVCPADAVQEIKNEAHFITQAKGGDACVREVIELVLKAHNQWNF